MLVTTIFSHAHRRATLALNNVHTYLSQLKETMHLVSQVVESGRSHISLERDRPKLKISVQ